MKKLYPQKVRVIALIILAVGAVIGFMGIGYEQTAVTVIGALVILSSIFFKLIFYRCPHCGRFLDRSTGEYCPYCGEKVNES